jgi:hypothetical protein
MHKVCADFVFIPRRFIELYLRKLRCFVGHKVEEFCAVLPQISAYHYYQNVTRGTLLFC